MLILGTENAHAVFNGTAVRKWVAANCEIAKDWIALGVATARGFVDYAKGFIQRVKDKAKSIFSFLRGWFNNDPVGAGAAVGLVLIGGAILVGGAASLGLIGGGAGALIAGILGTVKTIGIVSIIGMGILGGARFIMKGVLTTYNFDWNVTVAGIREKQKQLLQNIIANSGEATGTALGGLICGINKNFANVLIDVKFAASLWRAYDEDIRDEILDGFGEIVAMARSAARQIAMLELYHNARSFVKANIRTGIEKIDKAIAAWGKEGSQPFVFSQIVEQHIEKIKDETLKNFVEEAVEGFIDICREALWKPI
jgi:hypothetical protein